MEAPTPMEQMLKILVNRRNITIGLPAPRNGGKRFPFTPEAAGMLVERGFTVKMQQDAGEAIHYHDLRYQQHGVEIVERAETLRCDIVIYLSEMLPSDVRAMKRGGLVLTTFNTATANLDSLQLLLTKGIITIALDLVQDENKNYPFADIIAEISGRAAIAIASSILADSDNGKGILLGGVSGIVPCEVTILGSGINAVSAARSALGLGAVVRMFDNDVYRLRSALHELGPGVMGSALHPHVLVNALRSADVVIATDVRPIHLISAEVVNEMKRGVIAFDMTSTIDRIFPSLSLIDAGLRSYVNSSHDEERICFINPENAVPRTVAMALSNTFLTMITEMFSCDGLTNALMLNRGLQVAALTFLGKPVNITVAKLLGLRHVDINLLLQFS